MSAAPPVVWVVAARASAVRWVAVLREHGVAAGALIWAEARPLVADDVALPEAELVLFTSRQALDVLAYGAGDGRRAACVGAGTARDARAKGFEVVLVGEQGGAHVAARIGEELPGTSSVLWLRGEAARPEARDALVARGIEVHELPVYAMVPAEDFGARVAAAPPPDAVIVGSPRAVDALAAAGRALPEAAHVITPGALTAEHVAATWKRYGTCAPSADADGLAEAVLGALDPSKA